MRSLGALAAVIVAAGATEIAGAPPTSAFAVTAVALALSAATLGDATEDLAVHLGARCGGLLNALLCNAPQIVVALCAVAAGLPVLAKASLVGAMLANALLVLGVAAFLGGLRHGTQYFDRTQAGLSGTMLVLSVLALMLPALLGHVKVAPDGGPLEQLSEGVAAVMMLVYVLGLYSSIAWNPTAPAVTAARRVAARRSARHTTAALASALLAVLFLAWQLVRVSRAMLATTGATELFLGAIIVPLAAGVPQRVAAIELAWRNRMDATTSIVLGSSIQLLLFVAPLLVFASLLLGQPMDLVFTEIELAALAAAVLVSVLVALDGESHWLEGVMLVAIYVILALVVHAWPAPSAGGTGLGPTGLPALASLSLLIRAAG